AKTKSWMPQPKFGRICRSPRAVERISQMERWTSCSALTQSSPPAPLTRMGKAQPVPRKSRDVGPRGGIFVAVLPLPRELRVDVLEHADHGLERVDGVLEGRRVRGAAEAGELDGRDAGDLQQRLD